MATEKQSAANRRNAQRSTGPRTGAGKARAAMNNVKHGAYAASEIIPGEDLAEREVLAHAYMERFAPDNIEQLHLVQVLIRLDWEETRLAKAEAHLWTYSMRFAYEPEPDTLMGQGFARYKETFQWLGRRRDANHRKYLATLRDLQTIQAESAPQHVESEPETEEMASNPTPTPQSQFPTPAPEPRTPIYRPAQAPPPVGGLHPNPAHPPIAECPNCSRLGYPSPGCQYKKPKAS
jgi:hypothetical protein